MIIEDVILRIFKLKCSEPRVIELSEGQYMEFMEWVMTNQKEPILMGDTGYNQEKNCYVFIGCEIRRAA